MMTRSEILARMALLLTLIGLPLIVFGYERLVRPAAQPHRVIEVQAYAPEAGGFKPAAIRVAVGETVTLRFTAMDVTHGVAIGPGLDADLGYIDPGEQGEITLTFDEPGTYTYYCTTWCSVDHWRMRGVIEVRDPADPAALPPARSDPVIERLVEEGVNIDAMHTEGGHGHRIPSFPVEPSAARGAALVETATVLAQLMDVAWRREHTPNEGVALLQTANPALTETDLRDITAYLWQRDIAYDAATARQYDLNCAACHGETGRAEGPAAPFTAAPTTAFANEAYMFTMRADVLYAKIRRGGMGTDMPNFGTIFTPEETWALVDYLWWLALAEGPGDPS
jgi:plastocyanin